MAVINKFVVESLEYDNEVLYVEKREFTYFLGIPIYQKILNTANMEMVSKFRCKDVNPIGFNIQNKNKNEDKSQKKS